MKFCFLIRKLQRTLNNHLPLVVGMSTRNIQNHEKLLYNVVVINDVPQ